jgi:hypothetical protein
MTTAELSLQERVAVERFLGSLRAQRPDIAAVHEKAEERKLYPWKVEEERALRLHQRFGTEFAAATSSGTDPFDALKTAFIANAKAGLLGPEHTLILSYLLFSESTQYGAFLLANLLLHVPSEARLSTHNWGLAQEMEPTYRHSMGTRIATLDRPLFPPNAPGSDALNAKLLTALPVGGARPDQGELSILPQLTGAGYLAVGQLNDGSWAADSTPLEAELRRQIDGMERKLTSLGYPPRRRPQQQQQTSRQPAPQPQQQQQQPSTYQQHQAVPYRSARQRGLRAGDAAPEDREQQSQRRSRRPAATSGGAADDAVLDALFSAPTAPSPHSSNPKANF